MLNPVTPLTPAKVFTPPPFLGAISTPHAPAGSEPPVPASAAVSDAAPRACESVAGAAAP